MYAHSVVWRVVLLAFCFALCLGGSHFSNSSSDIVAVKIGEYSKTHHSILALKHGFISLGSLGWPLEEYHLFQKADHWTESHPNLDSHPEIEWTQPQKLLLRSRREWTPPQDPLFSQQWHLHVSGSSPNINTMPVWASGIQGQGVTVAIVDDGLQQAHPDLAANFHVNGSWDFIDNKPDPTPITIDSHGTSASGCVGAAENRACGVGVAYNAKISGIRIMKGDSGVNDAGEAKALSFKCEDINDIFTCSWGPYDDGKRLEGPGTLTKAAIQQCIEKGRKGKGTIYVWACGNGRSNSDNINYDGYANSKFTIAIGAITDYGVRPWYAEGGSPLMAVTPSSGGRSGIVSDGIHRPTGGDCTSNFGGTSASSPIAAGVVALMLQANKNLGWRDVQHIIARTSRSAGINEGNWIVNGGGLKHSHEFGFGLLDADSAVNMSKTWVNVGAVKKIQGGESKTYSIPVGKSLSLHVEVKDKKNFHVEHVEVYVKGTMQPRGNLIITLVSPSGAESYLQEKHSKDTATSLDWTYMTVRNWEEDPNGMWTVQFGNEGNVAASITSYSVTIYGYEKTGPFY
eukprot:TRINITY_DN2951_c0_g1_i2.p1 TRINITY_DN2951_c0_g1~~TRINITY_DN2951_c0_g1_i2.p1  ORF type:complete len:570 (-),score=132.39 TRINITY_DN2951_c0_g1_i2:70-1779(-)